MFRPFKYIVVAFICLFLNAVPIQIYGQQLGFYFEKPRKKVNIPFELYNNLIVISVKLNNTHDLKFILDTGVRNTILIDKNLADSVGLAYQREIELYGVGDTNSVKALVVSGVNLTLKSVESSNLSLLVLQENLLQLEHHLGTEINGILGYDFFSRFIVKVNYQKMVITLYEPAEFQPPAQYSGLDMELVDSKPIVNLAIDQKSKEPIEARLLVDTGASHALILNPLSSEFIQVPDRHINANLGRSIAGELSGKLGRIDHLSLGEYKMEEVIVSYINETPQENNPTPDKNGSIGGELLRKFTVIFDYLHHKLYLKPNNLFNHPFEFDMSGLEFIAQGKDFNKYIIQHIRPGSATDQIGFASGDEVVSLNNIAADKLTLSKIYFELSEEEGKKINLTVFRDGNFISKSFFLKKEI